MLDGGNPSCYLYVFNDGSGWPCVKHTHSKKLCTLTVASDMPRLVARNEQKNSCLVLNNKGFKWRRHSNNDQAERLRSPRATRQSAKNDPRGIVILK